jgi:hypothetical protein
MAVALTVCAQEERALEVLELEFYLAEAALSGR